MMLWFDACEALCLLFLKLCYRYRATGVERVPFSGPCIFISNHQSLLDPVINGCAVIDRQFTAIARAGLFKFKPFAWLMRSYGVIALKEDGGDAGAFRAALSELREGRTILIYPEGTRSPDGSLQPFRPGVALLIRRAKVPVVPMGIEGATEVWPRGQRFPRLSGRIEVEVGEPIPFEALPSDGRELLDVLHTRVNELVARRTREMLRTGWRTPRFPPHAPGRRSP